MANLPVLAFLAPGAGLGSAEQLASEKGLGWGWTLPQVPLSTVLTLRVFDPPVLSLWKIIDLNCQCLRREGKPSGLRLQGLPRPWVGRGRGGLQEVVGAGRNRTPGFA